MRVAFFDGHLIQPGLTTEAARIGSKGAAQPFGGVDALTLVTAAFLYKSCSCCFGERKYLSSTSGIKISDNVQPIPGLRDCKIFAVETLPFHTIPQSVQCIEDRCKRPVAVMRQQAGYVFKQQIRRVPGFSQAGKLKEESASWISESFA